ncbi:MAG TPA: hypothetical protein VLX44_05565 [Xanthobacteraceae bacterium]|nr:hypothetical protein [Xanthobacteraceae bacterium]
MNVQQIDRGKFLAHLRAVEGEFPLRFIATLPRGTAAHVFEEDAVDLLAEKREGLSLLGLCEAEVALAARIGRPVGTVLVSGLKGSDGERVMASARPL